MLQYVAHIEGKTYMEKNGQMLEWNGVEQGERNVNLYIFGGES